MKATNSPEANDNAKLAIQTTGLCRSFGSRKVVDNVSIEVAPGSIYGFLGPNGSGKTTTIKMLLGLLRPDTGRVLVHGIDSSKNRREVSAMMGSLLEANSFYPNMSGRQNLAMTACLIGATPKDIDYSLEVVELRNDAGRKVEEYSLGMRQRLGIARALLGRPKVLILDEPTNGLDPNGISDMRNFLRRLPSETGASILLSSHLLSEVEQIVTHLGIICEGRLIRQGSLSGIKESMASDLLVETDCAAKTDWVASQLGLQSRPGRSGCYRTDLYRGRNKDLAAEFVARLVQSGVSVYSVSPETVSLEELYRNDLENAQYGGSRND